MATKPRGWAKGISGRATKKKMFFLRLPLLSVYVSWFITGQLELVKKKMHNWQKKDLNPPPPTIADSFNFKYSKTSLLQ